MAAAQKGKICQLMVHIVGNLQTNNLINCAV